MDLPSRLHPERLAQAVAERVVALVVEALDVDALVRRVDVNALLDRTDIERLLERVDLAALLGFLGIVFQAERRALHDLVAGTAVVHAPSGQPDVAVRPL